MHRPFGHSRDDSHQATPSMEKLAAAVFFFFLSIITVKVIKHN